MENNGRNIPPTFFTLKEFLEAGRLGPATVGASREEIHNWFWDDDYGQGQDPPRGRKTKGGDPSNLRYGCLEFLFSYNRLVAISFDLDFGHHLPAPFIVEGYFPKKSTNLAEFHSYLRKENIERDILPELTFPRQITLLVGIGVCAIFWTEDLKLAKLSLGEHHIKDPSRNVRTRQS